MILKVTFQQYVKPSCAIVCIDPIVVIINIAMPIIITKIIGE
jgi:hypothetical protein